MAVKIVFDAGHGFNTPGKRTPDGEREWSMNDGVVRAAIARLGACQGVLILRVDDPTGKTDISLSARTSRANAWGADVYISVHHNANAGRWGSHGGVETFVNNHPKANPASLRIANAVHPRIVKAMGLRDRGVKRGNLHVLRETNMPAILTEGGFMDSTTDIGALRSSAKLNAQGVAIAEGLVEYFKLQLKVTIARKGVAPVNNKPSSWAKTPWDKATENGIVDGSSPTNPLTREQFVVILDRLGLNVKVK